MTEAQKDVLKQQVDDVLAAGLTLQQERNEWRERAATYRAALATAIVALKQYAGGKTWPHIATDALQTIEGALQ